MKEIILSKFGKNKCNHVALVDDEDYEYLNQWSWNAHKAPHTYYVHRHLRNNEKINGKDKIICMHRVIMNTPLGFVCDHIDHDGLNNQKSNLRNCLHKDNVRNKKPTGESSKYLGVVVWKSCIKNKLYNHITAQICVDRKHMYLGSFKTEEDAARAYDVAAKLFFGEFANLNFK